MPSRPLYLWFLLLLATLPPILGQESPAWNRDEFLRRVRIIPTDVQPWQMITVDEELGPEISGAERDVYLRSDDGKWKSFDDDLIHLEIPEDPLLGIEAVAPPEARKLRFVGGAIGNTDRHFTRAYRITVGDGHPFGLVLVREAEWFDDGICLCGAIALERYRWADGNLLRFSLLEGGPVKKVQALGRRHRAVLFEWTHSVIPQETYARIGASLRLKEASPRTREEWMAETFAHDPDLSGKLGWVERGQDETALVALMGAPTLRQGGALIYYEDRSDGTGGGSRLTYRLPLRDGVFQGFDAEWCHCADLPPKEGSLAWARKVVDPERGKIRIPGLDPPAGPPAKIARAAREAIFRQFLLAEKQCDFEIWNGWCEVIHQLAERGLRDARVLDAIRRRLSEAATPASSDWDVMVLKAYRTKDWPDVAAHRLQQLLDGSAETKREHGYQAGNLFRLLPSKDPRYLSLVRTALKDADEGILGIALEYAEVLPQEESRPAARTALRSGQDLGVRLSAAALLGKVGTEEDLAWLKEQLAVEKDTSVQYSIKVAMREISLRPNTPKKSH